MRGGTVERLARSLPEGMRCIEAKVNAVVVWRKEWTDAE